MDPVDQAERFIHTRGHAHLVGVGGVGMAGLAWLLKERGLHVSGCDLAENRLTRWLARNGVEIHLGHHENHVRDSVDWLIRSTAVPGAHPEVRRANELDVPVSRRGEVLPALMRDRVCVAVSGTHGKTTTTAMIARMLDCGYFVGGEMRGADGVARDGEIMVVEADESDGTVAGYAPDYSVITNIEYDHMEHHASEAAFIACFKRLIANTKKRVHYRADDPICRALCEGNAKCAPFSLPSAPCDIPLSGVHNQWNAAAAVAVAEHWLSPESARAATRKIVPVARRFETVFESAGVRVISDYAHHPTEIAALIQTAGELKPTRLLGIFQPHRYTRTKALGADFPQSFDGMDQLWIAPVYAASERPLAGGTSTDLARRFSSDWDGRLTDSDSLESAWAAARDALRPGDVLLIIGAGDIERVAEWARKWCPGEGSNLLPMD